MKTQRSLTCYPTASHVFSRFSDVLPNGVSRVRPNGVSRVLGINLTCSGNRLMCHQHVRRRLSTDIKHRYSAQMYQHGLKSFSTDLGSTDRQHTQQLVAPLARRGRVEGDEVAVTSTSKTKRLKG
jgi:hypothetical protein